MDITNLPAKVMFLIWLNNALSKRLATQSKSNKKIIELGRKLSKTILVGRRQNNTPVIALPKEMTPWFFSMQVLAIGHTADGKLHILFGEKSVDLCITIPTSGDRGVIIGGTDSKTIDLYSYHLESNNNLYLSRPIGRVELMLMDSIQHILPDESKDEWIYDEYLDENFEIENPKNFENFSDPL